MDRFIKSLPTHTTFSEQLLGMSSCIVNLWGPMGSGKTWAIKNNFKNILEIDSDILRSKQTTVTFLERAAATQCPVFIDEWEGVREYIGSREIKGPVNSSVTIIISTEPISEDFAVQCVEWKRPPYEEVAKEYCTDPKRIAECAERSNGNLHQFVSDLQFECVGKRDIFKTPKEFIYNLLCQGGTESVSDHIGHVVHEPGYTWGVVQENYLDTPNKSMDFYADVANHMSLAGVYDDKIYEGNWHLLPFFHLHACFMPAHMIDHSLTQSKLRPGSLWTKYQNTCMRRKKLENIIFKNYLRKVDVESLMVIRDYCEKGEYSVLEEYHIDSQDLDILNHLAIVRKLKPKMLAQLKKTVREKSNG